MEEVISLSIDLMEDETDTTVKARLELRGEHFEATGKARRNPQDPPRPLVGEELAVARALGKLQDQLTEAAWRKIEKFLAT